MAKKKKKSATKSEKLLILGIKELIAASNSRKSGGGKKKGKSVKVGKCGFSEPAIPLSLLRKFIKASKIRFEDWDDGKDKDTDDPGPRMMINGKKSRHH